ncbi:histidinol-phosphate transaminase [Croceicoccus sp. F390]|uniref:Histidinol-phosphate aminotransferase n=1 Tax=Croceicoccus esteveae TaxID=3075597 RepID=A0ABU2ZIU8_9SPHN|nr:histidinol-phosphate transaminase [Croceicoccus sp. F390]MDT0576141.1 histidinol-phosphate transaminase [Croceicoccus sp. F390]
MDLEAHIAPEAGMTPQPKPWIMAIHAYVPGKSAAADGRPLIKLSANENPLGTSPAALAARHAAPLPDVYPDPDAGALRRAIAAHHDLDADRIVCGTGSDELLNLAAQGFAGAGDEVLYVRHGFAVYDIAARRCGATPVVAPDRDYGTDVDALLGCVTPRTKVVFVANPNNPTGAWIGANDMRLLHAGLPRHVLLVIDQAYGEYLDAHDDDGGMALAHAHPNVLVTRTFSKIYGLAGERIGWATGAPEVVAVLNRIRGPFNVTSAGQAAAIAALGDTQFVRRSRDHNAVERARFVAAVENLAEQGLRAVPSKGNFVLVLFKGALQAETALQAIAEAGFAVRWLPQQGLPHALRITIGTAAHMDAIMAVLRHATDQAAGPQARSRDATLQQAEDSA